INQLLSLEEKEHDRGEYAVTESQPETTAAADDAGRVRGPGPGSGDGQRGLPAVPAAPDGAGGGGAGGERAQGADQAGGLPDAEGLRQLRLHGPAVAAEAEGAGAGGGGGGCGAVGTLVGRGVGGRGDPTGHCPWAG